MKNLQGTLKITVLSAKKDMRNIYFAIGKHPMFEDKKCPVLFAEVELPQGYDYLKFTSNDAQCTALITRTGLSDDDVIKIATDQPDSYRGYVDDMPRSIYPFLYTTKDMTTLYLTAARIAESTNTRCPQIVVHRMNSGDTGRSLNTNEDYGRTIFIEIDDNPNGLLYMIEPLAHEMRHCWQHETDAKKYFAGYRYIDKCVKNLESYYLQPAEIDARAYALRFISEFYEHKFRSTTKYFRVNKKVEAHARKLSDKLFVWCKKKNETVI